MDNNVQDWKIFLPGDKLNKQIYKQAQAWEKNKYTKEEYKERVGYKLRDVSGILADIGYKNHQHGIDYLGHTVNLEMNIFIDENKNFTPVVKKILEMELDLKEKTVKKLAKEFFEWAKEYTDLDPCGIKYELIDDMLYINSTERVKFLNNRQVG